MNNPSWEGELLMKHIGCSYENPTARFKKLILAHDANPHDDSLLLEISVSYFLGNGVKRDVEKAFIYMNEAKKLDHPAVGLYLKYYNNSK